jgi:type VI protein secretion system component Hcp
MSRCAIKLLIASFALLIANVAPAASDAYLCITDPGYKGESIATGFTGCSELVDFGQTGFIDGSTPIARDIKLDKFYDTMSNPLRTAMVNQKMLNEVKIRMINTVGAGGPLEFFDLRLIGAHVDSAAMSWSSGGGVASPTETIGFSAASIEVAYYPLTKTGSLGTPDYTCWNVVTNTATNSACP